MFGPGRVETYIRHDVILEMLNSEELDISCILWYQIVLHSILATNGVNRCAFINPQSITETVCVHDEQDKTNQHNNRVATEIAETMNFHQEKDFFLAPYWQSRHWLLLVICPYQRTGYILDSIKKAVEMFNEDFETSHPMTWTIADCNQQSSNWECGYYVLKWMREFVMYRQYAFPNNLWNDINPIPEKLLDDVVNAWMTTFQSKYMK
ncbi:unnamed protein product [Lactuca virosa]|uniref:Ubiquitin-like protease family profile domain-containing protein n=1 Tax=Lactuca virosa TaxID=75947 RepID=A0AAU9MI00_9ASTR|nr:unnamed protein product [Lactuca virosa]